jgi:putative FmdB family regulatory protein
MLYEFLCAWCVKSFDVVRPVSEYDAAAFCPDCGHEGNRVRFPRKLHLYNTAVQEKQFNPALGCVATDREAKQIAKERGMIEVGNERVEQHVKAEQFDYESEIVKGL